MLQNYHTEAGKKTTRRARQNSLVYYRTTIQKQERNKPGQQDKIPCMLQNFYSEAERNQPGGRDKILLYVTELPYRSRKEINQDSQTREAYLAI
jgi:hypothetical protein